MKHTKTYTEYKIGKTILTGEEHEKMTETFNDVSRYKIPVRTLTSGDVRKTYFFRHVPVDVKIDQKNRKDVDDYLFLMLANSEHQKNVAGENVRLGVFKDGDVITSDVIRLYRTACQIVNAGNKVKRSRITNDIIRRYLEKCSSVTSAVFYEIGNVAGNLDKFRQYPLWNIVFEDIQNAVLSLCSHIGDVMTSDVFRDGMKTFFRTWNRHEKDSRHLIDKTDDISTYDVQTDVYQNVRRLYDDILSTSNLTLIERDVLSRHYLHGESFRTIAEKIDVTYYAVQKANKTLLTKIRRSRPAETSPSPDVPVSRSYSSVDVLPDVPRVPFISFDVCDVITIDTFHYNGKYKTTTETITTRFPFATR